MFSKRIGLGANVVSEIVDASVKRGIFHKGLYDSLGILTSHGIQSRYFQAVKRRESVSVEKRYLLVNLDFLYHGANIKVIYVDINPQNVNRSTQSRVEKSRVEKKEEAPGNSCPMKEGMEVVETDFGPVKVDSAWQRVEEAYQTNIGSLPMGIKLSVIQDLYGEIGEELTLYAIQLTNDRQPQTPPNYLIKIMQRWRDDGVDTLAKAKALVNDKARRIGTSTSPSPAAQQPADPYQNPFAQYLQGGEHP